MFTPTYNRGHTLGAVYETLKLQTFRDFEWLIVDDGSDDNTGELVQQWCREADFPIRYYWQENGGKHRARNMGVARAQGRLFFTLDSDDICVPNCLEVMKRHWDAIPDSEKNQFAGVTGLCAGRDGSVVGSKFPREVIDSDMFSIWQMRGQKGERCGFQRTDVMKEFPFPEIKGEKFMPESVVWYRIARKYKTRFFNAVLRIFEPNPSGLTSAKLRLLIECPRGKVLACGEYLTMPARLPAKLKSAVNYSRCSIHAGNNLTSIVIESPRPALVLLTMPLGIILYFKDRLTYRNSSRPTSSGR